MQIVERAMIPDWVLQLLMAVVAIIGGSLVFYFLGDGRKLGALWSGFAATVLLLLWVTLYIQNGIFAKRALADAAVFHGRIVPANEDTPWVPATVCSLMLGDDLQLLTRSSNQYVFTKDGRPYLKLRVVDGQLLVSASVVDSRGERIVQVLDNEFQASQERAFNPKQPDASTLIVRDFEGVEVLNIRYLNPRVIRVVGRFHLPGYAAPVEVLPADGVRWPGGGGLSHLSLDMTDAPDASAIAF